ncbi:MAG: VWA domain-containing protein [Clostridia bacterium]|nr:VWA domain-containing protein [Clostridia bacterium]
MGVTNSNKELNVSGINCGGSFKVRLSLTAAPDITTNPTDIVLILDRSGSMQGAPLTNLKNGAKAFIDIIDEATDGSEDGQIGSGSRIGIVSFADVATQDTQLITSVSDLKAAVDALTSDGSTNHEDAFTKALDLFDPASTNAKVMIMFTDGVTTAGGDPNTVATLAKLQGVIIYCIGLSGNGGIDVNALNAWSSDPDSAYVAITPDDTELEELFENLARNIANPGATNVVITDTVAPCFQITSISSPTKGSASTSGTNTVTWTIDALGVTASEGATFEFTVTHIGPCTGTVEVNESISYDDAEGNIVTFPSPAIEVDCGVDICPEGCPVTVDLTVDGCTDTVEFDAGELVMDSLGRIVQLDVTLHNVCPNRRVALAVMLNELDALDTEHKRGFKTMTIPAHTREGCRDVTVRCIKFVLPEDLDVSGETFAICNERRFRARLIANYVDYDFDCCCDTDTDA